MIDNEGIRAIVPEVDEEITTTQAVCMCLSAVAITMAVMNLIMSCSRGGF